MTALRIGIDLGDTKIESVLMDATGNIVERERIVAPRDDYDATLAAMVSIVGRHDRKAGGPCRIGVGTPGVWDPLAGAMKNCNSTWLNGRALQTDLETALGARVRLANDANCFALSEAVDGAAMGVGLVFGVILGTGVGGGVVVDRKVIAGVNGICGEWGHVPLPYFREDPLASVQVRALEASLAPRQCYCGRSNCVETFLSGPGLVRMHRELWGETLTAPEIAAASATRTDATMEVYTTLLARSLAQVVNVLDPEVVVLGGGLSNVPSLYSTVTATWAPYVFSSTVRTRLVAPRHGDAGGVRGAAWLWPAS